MTDDNQNRNNVVAQWRHSKPFDERQIEDSDGVAETIVSAISAITDTDPVEMDPIHEVVDVDALEDLFGPTAGGTPRSGGIVSFSYAGCAVTVEGTDRVKVRQQESQWE